MQGIETQLHEVIRDGLITPVYQPIVRIEDGEVVAYEALARGPAGSELERPDQLFPAAARASLTDELDWACRVAALRGALEAGLTSGYALFVNVEPGSAGRIPDRDRGVWRDAVENLRVIFEITERGIADRPADLLGKVARIRKAGWRVALDDVGADAGSLAMLPFVSPDVIKLDMGLVHEQPRAVEARIAHAVDAEVERSGAYVLAEGVETEEQRLRAVAMGARLAQGWLFGKPAPLPTTGHPVRPLLTPPIDMPDGSLTPYEIVEKRREVRTGTKQVLLAMSRHLEHQALVLDESPVVIGTFQHKRHFTPATKEMYEFLASKLPLVAAFAEGFPTDSQEQVKRIQIDPSDPLVGEWVVLVVGPHFAGGFAARDLGDRGPDADRRFDFATTYDRTTVVEMARSLLNRIGRTEP